MRCTTAPALASHARSRAVRHSTPQSNGSTIAVLSARHSALCLLPPLGSISTRNATRAPHGRALAPSSPLWGRALDHPGTAPDPHTTNCKGKHNDAAQ